VKNVAIFSLNVALLRNLLVFRVKNRLLILERIFGRFKTPRERPTPAAFRFSRFTSKRFRSGVGDNRARRQVLKLSVERTLVLFTIRLTSGKKRG
jgi:hypothetical protein